MIRGLRQEYLSRVTKGERSAFKGEWENAVSGKKPDSVEEETLVVSAAEVIVDRMHNRPLLLQKRRHRLMEENPRKVLVPGENGLLEEKAGKRAKKFSKESM